MGQFISFNRYYIGGKMKAGDLMILSEKLDTLLSEVDDVKQMLVQQAMKHYKKTLYEDIRGGDE